MLEWRAIEGFPGYEVSNSGCVRGKRGIVSLRSDRKGYLAAPLWIGMKVYKRTVARLVAAAFIGPRPEGHVVRHLDGVKTNNVPSNLAYGTPADNERDKRSHGTAPIGMRHGSAKLTDDQVLEIRRRFAPYHRSNGVRAMAREFGVCTLTVHKIVHRELWRHLD